MTEPRRAGILKLEVARMDKHWDIEVMPDDLTLDIFIKSPEEAEARRRARTPEEEKEFQEHLAWVQALLDRSKTQEK